MVRNDTTKGGRMKREVISQAMMLEFLKGLRSCTAISADISSVQKMNKTGNPFYEDGVTKEVTLSGLIGLSYSRSVNNQLGRENKELDFTAKQPVWFEYLEGSSIVGTNKNKRGERYYFAMKVQSTSKPSIYKDKYGKTIEGEDLQLLKSFIQKSSKPKTQAALDTEIIWRTIALDSIQSIRILGVEMIVCAEEMVESERSRIAELETEEKQAELVETFSKLNEEEKATLDLIRSITRAGRDNLDNLIN